MTILLRYRVIVIVVSFVMECLTVCTRNRRQKDFQTRFPGFNEQHTVLSIGGKAICKDTSRRPTTEDDDVVVGL